MLKGATACERRWYLKHVNTLCFHEALCMPCIQVKKPNISFRFALQESNGDYSFLAGRLFLIISLQIYLSSAFKYIFIDFHFLRT